MSISFREGRGCIGNTEEEGGEKENKKNCQSHIDSDKCTAALWDGNLLLPEGGWKMQGKEEVAQKVHS